MKNQKEINLQPTVEETNTILEALSRPPFNKVFSLIGKIQTQAGEPLNQQEESKEDGNKK